METEAARPVLEGAVAREVVTGDGKSGSYVERVTLADGTRVVVKHVIPYGDWIMRSLDDGGRVVRLWREGVFDRVPAAIDHAILAVEDNHEGWLVVMRDVTDDLVHGRKLTRAEHQRVVRAAAELHDAFRATPVDGLCPLGARYRLLDRDLVRREPGLDLSHAVSRGWEIFADVVGGDTGTMLLALLEDPSPLATRLSACEQTLVHGDLKIGNLALTPARVVMLDWGTQTGMAPPAVEWAWYLAINGNWIDATREEVLDDCRAASGDRHDGAALDLALVGALLQLGWNKALDAYTAPDPVERASERADLEWWVATATGALERCGL